MVLRLMYCFTVKFSVDISFRSLADSSLYADGLSDLDPVVRLPLREFKSRLFDDFPSAVFCRGLSLASFRYEWPEFETFNSFELTPARLPARFMIELFLPSEFLLLGVDASGDLAASPVDLRPEPILPVIPCKLNDI